MSVGLSVPASGVLLNYLRGSSDTRVALEGSGWHVLVGTTQLAGLISVLLAVGAGLFAVCRGLQRWRVLGLVAAVAMVLPTRVLIDHSAQFAAGLGDGAKTIVGWWLVTAATAMSRRTIVTASVAAVVSLGCVVVLLRPSTSGDGTTNAVLILGAAALMILVTVGLIAMFQLLVALFRLREDEKTDYWARALLRGGAVVTVACAIAAPLGRFVDSTSTFSELLTGTAQKAFAYAADIAGPLWQLAPLLVVALVAREIIGLQRLLCNSEAAFPIAFMLALAAPVLAAPVTDTRSFTVVLPLWLAQMLVLWLGFRMLLPPQSAHDPVGDARLWRLSRSDLLAAVQELPPGTTESDANTTSDGAAGIERRRAGELLLLRGTRDSRMGNARAAASLAGYLAVVPVVYFAWTTLGELGEHLQQGVGPLLIFTAILAEAARWTVAGFIFGYFYPLLPSRIGPIKALWFAGLWTLGGLASAAVARALDLDLSQPVLYRSAQFALFVIVLAVLIDVSTIRSAGGSILDLKKTYALQNYSEIAAAVAPALLLTLTLAQQVMAGSGLDVAKTFLGGIPTLF